MKEIEFNCLIEFFDKSTMPFFFAVAGGKELFFNDAFCQLLGYQKEELYSMDRIKLLPKDLIDHLEEKQSRMISTGRPQVVEKVYIRKDGAAVPAEVHLHIRKIRDGDGETDFFYAFIIDKSESKEMEKQQRDAEEALKSSEEKFSRAFQYLPNIVCISSMDGIYLEISNAFTEILGYSREETVGKSSLDYGWTKTEDRNTFVSELHRNGFVRELEFPFGKKSGEIISALISAVKIQIDGKEYLLTSLNDVTQRKQTDEALVESENKYRSLVEHMLEGMMIIDFSGNVLMANPSVLRLMGFDLSGEIDVSGYNIMEFLHPSTHAQAAADMRTVSAGKDLLREYRVIRRDGTVRWMETHGTKIVFQGQAADLILFHDITERKEAELELMETQQRMADIINFLPDATLAIDLEGRVISWNKAAEEMTGIKAEDILGKGNYEYSLPFYGHRRPIIIDLVLKSDQELEINYPDIEKRGKILAWEGRCPALGKTGAYLRATASPLYDSHGKIVGAIESIRDATRQKKAEEQTEFLSVHDSLTGLYNRTFFEEEMLRLKSGRYNPVGIIICDVDGLKLVNDTLGHDAGDKLLVEAAKVIKECFHDGEVISRVGGDEFTVLIPNAALDVLESAVQRARRNIEEYNDKNPELPLSISIGFSASSDKKTSVYEVFRQADNNMYREKLRRKQSNRSAIVQTLMKALETRDFLTKGHAERMQNLAVALAEKIGLSESRINDLVLLAQFHDIGKVGVSDSILFKPGPLTPEEKKEMQKHCEKGYHIALAAPDLAPIANWILKHQEWWDGNGYPLGLKGEEIPLECRIIAIVDAYDAMTSDRPYRKAMSHEAAVEEIIRCSGKQFDSSLVELFIEVSIMERATLN